MSRRQTLAAGTIKRLHVNRHVIADNRKTGKRSPALTIQTSHGPFRAHVVNILGPSNMVYSPDKPLSCGAVAWIETRSAVVRRRSARQVGHVNKPGAHAGFVRRSGGGWEAVALFRSIKWPNARRSAHSSSWARERIDAIQSLKIMVR